MQGAEDFLTTPELRDRIYFVTESFPPSGGGRRYHPECQQYTEQQVNAQPSFSCRTCSNEALSTPLPPPTARVKAEESASPNRGKRQRQQ